jgi:hypothetical protein
VHDEASYSHYKLGMISFAYKSFDFQDLKSSVVKLYLYDFSCQLNKHAIYGVLHQDPNSILNLTRSINDHR